MSKIIFDKILHGQGRYLKILNFELWQNCQLDSGILTSVAATLLFYIDFMHFQWNI